MVDRAPEDSLARFRHDRFGMFIHYGLYSVLGRSEWAMYNEAIPASAYRGLADRPMLSDTFSPAEWVRLAVESGARYCVLTTRHHEGYCLWDTATTDFSSTRGPMGRDLVREFTDAARAAGLGVGLYYSLLDWSDPGYVDGPVKNPSAWAAFKDKVHRQVTELMTGYGAIDILWYDGFWPIDNPPYADEIRVDDWDSQGLNNMVRSLQPGILINDRSGIKGDFSTPEQQVMAQGRPWEACMTTNDNWGWHAGDLNWKTPRQTLGSLIHSVSLGGNFILNIGPRADGSVPAPALDCLRTMGRWLEKNGTSIYGCGKPPHIAREALDGGFFCNSGVWTRGADALYYHVLRWPGSEFGVRTDGISVRSVRLLTTGEAIPFTQSGSELKLRGLPSSPPDTISTVLEVKYES